MNYRNSQVLIASSLKGINNVRVTGKLDTRIIHIFKIFDYYINYTQEAITLGDVSYKDTNSLLKKNIQLLWYEYPNVICNSKITSSLDNPTNNTNPSALNTAPTASNNTINIGILSEYTFKTSDLIVNYYDANNNGYKDIKIFPSTLVGKLYYNNIEITSPVIISTNDINKLKFVRSTDSAFTNFFYLIIGDNNINQLFSAQITITITGDQVSVANNPPIIGDNTIYKDNRTTTILTLEMFTSQLAPPYNDPENDLIDAIRIDSISTSNIGIYYLNNTPIIPGLIILREELIAGAFKHIGANIDTVSSDSFTFSARDEGSLIWVN